MKTGIRLEDALILRCVFADVAETLSATRVCLLLIFPSLSNANVDRRWGNVCCYRSQDLVSHRRSKISRCLCDLIAPCRLDPADIGMVVDRGRDFPPHIQAKLDSYGSDMWLFRDDPTRGTTKALNHYRGDHRGFVNRLLFIYNIQIC